MNEEIWKIIKEAPDYSISNFGRVKSNKYKNPKILKQKITKNNYHSIGLNYKSNKRKWFLVHRLVLSTFNPIENMDLLEVNHKDENKHNNNLDNLEWVTSKENCNYGTRNRKLGILKKVRCIETGIIYNSCKEASELTSTCRSSISNCLKGKRNKAGNCHWEEVA